jgi:hypothetical protein
LRKGGGGLFDLKPKLPESFEQLADTGLEARECRAVKLFVSAAEAESPEPPAPLESLNSRDLAERNGDGEAAASKDALKRSRNGELTPCPWRQSRPTGHEKAIRARRLRGWGLTQPPTSENWSSTLRMSIGRGGSRNACGRVAAGYGKRVTLVISIGGWFFALLGWLIAFKMWHETERHWSYQRLPWDRSDRSWMA